MTSNDQPFDRDEAVLRFINNTADLFQAKVEECDYVPDTAIHEVAIDLGALIDACIANVTKDCYCYTKPAFMNRPTKGDDGDD